MASAGLRVLLPFSAQWVPAAMCGQELDRGRQRGSRASCMVLSCSGRSALCQVFFGPMILAPEANQGPLLGIFITGPLSMVVGAVGGLVYALA